MRKRTTPPEVLWRDGLFGIFNKPPDVIVYDTRGGESFLSRIQSAYSPTAQVCHRLDATTSGALLVAFNNDAQRMGTQLFEKRLVQKTYLTLCEGLPAQDAFTVDAPLLEDGRRARVSNDGVPARTEFTVAARGSVGALLVARPHTGRFHQIRAHLAHVGNPVMGDERYGASRQVCVALHSARLAFAHPVSGAPVAASAPVHALFLRVASRAGVLASQVETTLAGLSGGAA